MRLAVTAVGGQAGAEAQISPRSPRSPHSPHARSPRSPREEEELAQEVLHYEVTGGTAVFSAAATLSRARDSKVGS